MLEEQEARERILEALRPLPSEIASLDHAAGCFAAEDVVARVALPSFDNSGMDGYAVRAASARNGARLKLVGEQPAGTTRELRVGEGEAVRIFTGAPLPAGADAVVMQEEAEREGDAVLIRTAGTAPGDFVRRAGGDLSRGQLMLRAGERLSPAAIGLLATQGLDGVQVHRRPRVAVVSSGDELVSAGETLQPGEVYDSNGVMLGALVAQTGGEISERRRCADKFEEVCSALRSGAEADAMIISGGVSVGDHDLIRPALDEIGAEIELWRVAIKPGKPFLFGRLNSCAIFGLPGNPVSSFVTFHLFVRPALLRLMGANEEQLTPIASSARLGDELSNQDRRPHYFRGQLKDGVFHPVGRQESHALFGLSRANALLRMEPGQRLPAGAICQVILLN